MCSIAWAIFEPAIEMLDLALVDAGDEAPRRAQILGDRALALGGMGHHDEAIAEAEQALDAGAARAPSLNHVLGFVLYFAGRVSDAIPPIQRALELDPAFAPALKTLALAQAAAGKADDAIDVLQRALRQNPLDRDAILQLSFLHMSAERFQQALDTLEPYLKDAARRRAGAQQPGPGAARPEASRRGAAGAEARLPAAPPTIRWC